MFMVIQYENQANTKYFHYCFKIIPTFVSDLMLSALSRSSETDTSSDGGMKDPFSLSAPFSS